MTARVEGLPVRDAAGQTGDDLPEGKVHQEAQRGRPQEEAGAEMKFQALEDQNDPKDRPTLARTGMDIRNSWRN
jgi:hypothetical protein